MDSDPVVERKKRLSLFLTQLRDRLGVSQEVLADRIGASSGVVAQWEGSAKNRVSRTDPMKLEFRYCAALAKVAGITLDEFYRNTQNEGCDPSTDRHRVGDKIVVTEKSELIALLTKAPLDWYPDLFRTLVDRLDSVLQAPLLATAPVTLPVLPNDKEMNIAAFIRQLFSRNGFDIDDPATKAAFIEATGGYPVEDFDQFLDNRRQPTRLDWGDIACGINELIDRDVETGYSEQELARQYAEYCQSHDGADNHVGVE